MKPNIKIICWIAVLAAFLVLPSFATTLTAASNEVALVYRGNTPVNRDTINYIRKEASRYGATYTYRFFTDPAQVAADGYKAVVLISTGVSTGIDPVFDRYIQASSTKAKIIVVSLLAGSSTYTVSLAKSSGVDTITAASAWSEGHGGRGRNSNNGSGASIMQMHQDWVRQLVALIGTR